MRYTDFNFQSNYDDSRSVSGYVFTLNGGTICWKSSKQLVIADSIIEIEYIAISEVAKEAFWFKKLVAELGVMPSDAITLHCDNNGVITFTKKFRSHQKSKHIER